MRHSHETSFSNYTLIGESPIQGVGLIGTARTNRDSSLKRLEMILFLRRKLTDSRKKTFRKKHPKRKKRPGYENDEPDYEDEEIAGYMDGDDDTGRATGVSFDELGEAVRTANADNPTEAEKRQTAGTLTSIEGTNLYDAVVENINGGLAKVAELLGRNEAELAAAAVPAGTVDTSEEHEAFDMNDFL